MTPGITVVIPTIAGRRVLLNDAVKSVRAQTLLAAAVVVEKDTARRGAGVTRTAGLFRVETEFTAFLDDDDLLYPQHLERLAACQAETGADAVYPWFDVVGGTDPFPQFEGVPWDPAAPHSFPITALVRTELAHDVGGFPDVECEDLYFWYLINLHGTIVHLPERSWAWTHWPGNTSGRPDR